MKTKKIVLLALAAMMVLGTTACSKKEPTEKKIRVGFTVIDLTNPYFTTLIKGITDRQDRYGMELVVHDGKGDATSQVTAIENFITQDVDMIVVHPINVVTPESAIKEAQKAGIPVASWSELVKGSDAFFTMRQYQLGYFAGEIAGKWAKEHFPNQADAKVMFVLSPTSEALVERGTGIKEGFLAHCPGATVVAEQAGDNPEAGMKAVESTLVNHPDLNVIVTHNDAVSIGAYNVMLQTPGKNAENTCIVGIDAIPQALEYIRAGTMYKGTVDLGAYDQGELFCSSMTDIVKNGPPKDTIYVSYKPVTKDNIEEFFE